MTDNDPFPNWKPGEQFCMYCGLIVKFPHQCAKLLDSKNQPTHEWTQCLEKSHDLKHKVDGRSDSGRYVKCAKCTWHVPMEYVSREQMYKCPGETGNTYNPFTGSTYQFKGTCPRCNTVLKAVVLDRLTTRWFCPNCNPTSDGNYDTHKGNP